MNQLSEYERLSLQKLERAYYEDKWSNAGLVELARVVLKDYLKAKRVSNFAKGNGITPQGARRFRPVFEIDGYQFIADNE